MLNLKKGLAMVLAAATAFTFAPVANLGASVDAQAATATQGYNLISADFNSTVTAGAAAVVNNSTTSSSVLAKDWNSLTLLRTITVAGGHTYTFDEASNVEHFKWSNSSDGPFVEVPAKSTFTVGGAANADYKIYVEFDLTSQSGGAFTLLDMTQGGNRYENIRYSVTNTNNLTKAKNEASVKVYTVSGSAASFNDKSFVEAPHTNVNNGNTQYTLTLNNSDDYYYIGVKEGQNLTSWTGVNGTINSNYAESVSGNLTWRYGDTSSLRSYFRRDNGIKTTADDYKIYESSAFHVTTAIDTPATVTVHFTGTYTGVDRVSHSIADRDSLKSIYYVTERSNNAVDWIKWNNSKIVDTDWQNTGNSQVNTDLYTLRTAKEMNPYDKKKATIVVKSESRDITFISSDTTILTVTKDPAKYYKATVQATKKSGTATISIYVGGTNNNKGKVFNIPVTVNKNGNDTLTIEEGAKLLGNEVDNTVYLDAADQTGSNVVTSDVLTVTSDNGLKLETPVENDPDDAITVTTNGNVTTVTAKAKIADLKNGPKTASVTFASKTDSSKNLVGAQGKTITFVVWGKKAREFTVDPVYLSLNDASQKTKTLSTKPQYSNVVWSVVDDGSDDEINEGGNTVFEFTNVPRENRNNTQTTATVIARTVGTGEIKALVTEDATYRPTAKKVKVTVGSGSAPEKKASTLKVTSDKTVKLEVGKTSQVAATGTAISYSSSDASVASVDAKTGLITAVAPGSAVITVADAGNDDIAAGTDYVVVTVAATTVAPSKVTGIKVKNKKGAKVSVTWKAQDKSVLYRVYKKVGNGSWKAKNVTNAKATLDVKKGAKITVKVKAFRRDANGKAVWQSAKATKAKAFKTDKK